LSGQLKRRENVKVAPKTPPPNRLVFGHRKSQTPAKQRLSHFLSGPPLASRFGKEIAMINTLKYSKILQEAGIPREQAEAHILVMAEFVEGNLATKEDIHRLRHEDFHQLKNEDLVRLRNELKAEIQDLHHEIKQLEHRMTIKLGTIVTLALAAFATITRFF
jgi:hypothetical protein